MIDGILSDPYFDFEINDEIHTSVAEILKCARPKYQIHKYREGGANIDLIYPELSYAGELPFRSPDYIRHLLSIYPVPEDLSSLNKIIFRPRYFSSGQLELAALYLKKEGILVEYFHIPHLYEASGMGDKSDGYSFNLMTDSSRLGTGVVPKMKIKLPSMLYYIHVSAATTHNDIDKYFISTQNLRDRKIQDELEQKSNFYLNNGY